MIPLTVAPHLVHKVIVGAHGEPTDGPGRVNGNLLVGGTGFGDRGCGVHLRANILRLDIEKDEEEGTLKYDKMKCLNLAPGARTKSSISSILI